MANQRKLWSLKRVIRIINLNVVLLAAGSLIIYFNAQTFQQIDRSNLLSWLLHHSRSAPLKVSWLWIFLAAMGFLGTGCLYCLFQKGKTHNVYRKIAVFLFHLGFFLAVLGMIIDSVWGTKGLTMMLLPGESQSIAENNTMSLELADINTLPNANQRGGAQGLAKASLILRDKDKILTQQEAYPNHPLLYWGWAAFIIQSQNYWQGIRIHLEGKEHEVSPKQIIPLSDPNLQLQFDFFIPHMELSMFGQVQSASPSMENPAVHFSLLSKKTTQPILSSWLIQRFPKMNPLVRKGIDIKWIDNIVEHQALIHLTHHPGLGLVIIGYFFIIVATFCLLFFHLREGSFHSIKNITPLTGANISEMINPGNDINDINNT